MKKEVAVIFILILFSSLSFAIRFEGSRNICLPLKELNVQISFYPEIYKIYVATYNPHNESIYNMSFHVLTVDTKSHNIFTGKHIEFEVIPPNEFAHKLLDFDFEYNKLSRVMVYGLEFILKNKTESYYAATSPENFTIHWCMDINKWYRKTLFSFNGKKDVEDEIIFKKLCNETFHLTLFFPNVSSGAYVPVKHAEIIYDGHSLPLEIVTHEPKQRIVEVHEGSNCTDIGKIYVKYEKNISQRRSIEIKIPSELYTNKPLKLKLQYHLRTQFPIEKIEWSVPLINASLDLSYWKYPFMGTSFRLDTGDITLNEVYVSSSMGKEDISSVELYTHELYLPSGFTTVKNEKTTHNNRIHPEGDIIPIVFSPNQNCLKTNKTKVPGLPYLLYLTSFLL